MAIFGAKPFVIPLGKMSIFRLFEFLVFIAQKDVIFILEYRKRDFPELSYLRKIGKMAIFGRKPLEFVIPLGKMSIFRLFKLRLFKGQRAVFSYQNIVKKHFPGLLCFKKKVRKMPILIPKPWVNPFGKISIFRLFKLRLFKGQRAVFSYQNIVKKHFPGLLCFKKKVRKMPILIPKSWVNPFGKMSIFFDFLNFFVLKPRKAFFRFGTS